MAFAIEFLMDERTEAGVRKLWSDLSAMGISTLAERFGGRPAITASVFVNVDPAKFRFELKNFANLTQPFDAQFVKFDDKGGNIGLHAARGGDLDRTHIALFSIIKKAVQSPRPEYGLATWQPQCLLAEQVPPAHLVKAAPLLAQIPMPIPFRVVAISLIQVNQTRAGTIFEAGLGGSYFKDRATGK